MNLQYPAASAVKVPVSGSIKRQVFEALARGERLTSLDAWARFGTSRLASLVHQLRVVGWPILSETVTVDTAHGHQASVAAYFMSGEAIEAARAELAA